MKNLFNKNAIFRVKIQEKRYIRHVTGSIVAYYSLNCLDDTKKKSRFK